MKMNEYQAEMRRTRPPMGFEEGLTMAALGLCGESGEFADLVKKMRYHGHHLSGDQLLRELGDVLWYIAAAAEALGVDLETIATLNVEKLRARYPNGFDPERSRHRVETFEERRRRDQEGIPLVIDEAGQ